MPKPIKKAVFPVGGLGTRFLPATKSMAKEMLPIASKPMIQHAFEEAYEAGIDQFIFVTGRNKNTINNHFDRVYELESILSEHEKSDALEATRQWLPNEGNIAFVRQGDALGLGHAVWCARHMVGDEPFAVLLADEMLQHKGGFLKEMIDLYNETGENVVAVTDVPEHHTSRYGIIDPKEDDGKVVTVGSMIEKPDPKEAPSNTAIIGRYILQPEIFTYLSAKNKGSGGEIQLTDAMVQMLDKRAIHGLRYNGKRFDCGNQLGFLEANIAYALENPDIHDDVVEMLKKYP